MNPLNNFQVGSFSQQAAHGGINMNNTQHTAGHHGIDNMHSHHNDGHHRLMTSPQKVVGSGYGSNSNSLTHGKAPSSQGKAPGAAGLSLINGVGMNQMNSQAHRKTNSSKLPQISSKSTVESSGGDRGSAQQMVLATGQKD